MSNPTLVTCSSRISNQGNFQQCDPNRQLLYVARAYHPDINCHFPNSVEMIKGHLKGQQQGIRSTKQKALDKLLLQLPIQINEKTLPFVVPTIVLPEVPSMLPLPTPMANLSDIFAKVVDLSKTITPIRLVHSPTHLSKETGTSW